MSPESQRIAIAEARGRSSSSAYCPTCKISISRHDDCISGAGYHKGDKGCGMLLEFSLPDYLSDLNAMHEVFMHIRDSNPWMYWNLCKKLDGIVAIANSREDSDLAKSIATCDATAAQRAEAFLRTIGKWVEP